MSSGFTRRGNLRGIDVRPGAVRTAREEAGLSLRKVASPELSRAAVHLIEMGQSRPSLKTLRLIAARTGKPIEYFLAAGASLPGEETDERSLSELERLATTSDFSALLKASIALVGHARDGGVRCEAHLHAARAASLLGDPAVALEHAEAAYMLATSAKDEYSTANALAWQGAALLQLADARTLIVLNDALALARRLIETSAELEARILTNLASWFVSKQSWDEAAAAFDSAIRASEQTRDLARMARTYEGLAHVYDAKGQPDRASRLMERALAIYQMSSNITAEVRTRASYAEVLIHQQRLSDAREQIDAASQLFGRSGPRSGSGRLRLLAAEVSISEGDTKMADDLLEEASSAIDSTNDPVAYGELRRLQALRAAGNPGRYRALFTEAIAIFENGRLDQRATTVRREYAQALEADGRLDEALIQWKAAAGVRTESTGQRRATGA